jgi:uroporphyrinogen-III synthase
MSPGPLEGRAVLVTRPEDQAPALVRLLEDRGAVPVVAPAVWIRPPEDTATLASALADLADGRFDWITLTSRATVHVLATALAPADVRARIAVVGEGTGAALRDWGRTPDLVPARFETEALGAAFPEGRGRVLCLRADIAPPGLELAVEAKGWEPLRVDAYRTELATSLPPAAAEALRRGGVDVLTFTSASTVRGFVRAVTGPPRTEVAGNPKVVCIGPVTAREAQSHGLSPDAVADPHTLDGLVAAAERVFAGS